MEYYKSLSQIGYDKPSYWHEASEYKFIPLTVGQLLDYGAEKWGESEALVSLFENIRLSFRQVREKADELAAALLQLGLEPGDRLAILGFNSTIFYLTIFAAARAGLILTRIDPSNQGPELLHCLKKTGCKALIAAETYSDQNYYKIICNVTPEIATSEPGNLQSKELPELHTIIFTGDVTYPGVYNYHDIIKTAKPENIHKIRELQTKIQADDGASIFFTSGTTGSAKGVLVSHRSLVNTSYFSGLILGTKGQKTRTLVQMQLCHIASNMGMLLPTLHHGGTIVLGSSKFDSLASIRAFKEEKCVLTVGTPAMFVDIISTMNEKGISLSYPQIVSVVGAPLTHQLAMRIRTVLPVKHFINGYAMTEAGLISVNGLHDSEDKLTTVGHVVPHTEVKVVDTNGHLVPMETSGELWVRSYGTMIGYWGDLEKTNEVYTSDGWLKTGDQCILSEDGYICIVGRIKDAIIRGGDKIFPKDIEEFFHSHPEILDIQAFGVPDAKFGEEMCVYMRPKRGCSLTEKKIRQYCEGKLASFKIPRYIRFLDEFPKSIVGKVDKKMLQNLIKNEQEYLRHNEEITKRLSGN